MTRRDPVLPGGLLRIDKPGGPTSRDAVNAAVRALGTRRVGHAGTLDPFAEGLLLVVWGRATALVPYLQDYDKTYEAEAEFGRVTDTQDGTGTTLEENDATRLERSRVEALLPRFRGSVLQTPPMFSAVKVGGERLYEAARRGETVDRPPRERRVDVFDLIAWDPPRARFRIVCEGGTYVRTLVHDLGAAVGTGACVTRLVRTGIGPHRQEDAIAWSELADGAVEQGRVDPADALPDWPAVVIDDPVAIRAVRCGSWRGPIEAGTRCRLLAPDGALLALAEGGDPARLLRVFAGSEDGP